MGLPKRHIALSETAVSGGFQISMMTSPSEWAHCGGVDFSQTGILITTASA